MKMIRLSVPLAEMADGYCSQHIEVKNLTKEQAETLKQIRDGLVEAGEKIESDFGVIRPVTTNADTLRWLIVEVSKHTPKEPEKKSFLYQHLAQKLLCRDGGPKYKVIASYMSPLSEEITSHADAAGAVLARVLNIEKPERDMVGAFEEWMMGKGDERCEIRFTEDDVMAWIKEYRGGAGGDNGKPEGLEPAETRVE